MMIKLCLSCRVLKALALAVQMFFWNTSEPREEHPWSALMLGSSRREEMHERACRVDRGLEKPPEQPYTIELTQLACVRLRRRHISCTKRCQTVGLRPDVYILIHQGGQEKREGWRNGGRELVAAAVQENKGLWAGRQPVMANILAWRGFNEGRSPACRAKRRAADKASLRNMFNNFVSAGGNGSVMCVCAHVQRKRLVLVAIVLESERAPSAKRRRALGEFKCGRRACQSHNGVT